MTQQKSNITIQILSMLGGVLTAGLFIVFLLLLDVGDSSLSSIITSILLITGAILINRSASQPFMEAVNITFYISGCMLLLFTQEVNFTFLLFILVGISIFTYQVAKGFLLPFIAILAFNGSLFAAIYRVFSIESPYPIPTIAIIILFILINLFRDKLSQLPEKYLNYQSLHAGLFVSSIILLGAISINYYNFDTEFISPFTWIGLFLVVYQVMKVMEVKKLLVQCCVYAVTLIVCLPTFYAPYLSGSLLLIFLCFHYGYKKEFAASILLFIYTVSKYYYDLNLTLLVKSIILFFTGIVFIATWYFITQKKNRT